MSTITQYTDDNGISTHGQEQLESYLKAWFAHLGEKKKAAPENKANFIPPPLPTPPGSLDQYALSNSFTTNGKVLHLNAVDVRRRWTNKPVWINYLGKEFPTAESISERFKEQPVITVGIDPGEKISAGMCALDPHHPRQVRNLSAKRKSLYQPVLKGRSKFEMRRNRRQTHMIQAEPGKVVTVETPSIADQESTLQSAYSNIEQLKAGIKQQLYLFRSLRDFYSSSATKKTDFDQRNAYRGEVDMAISGALRLVPCDQGLFIYGNGKFNTRTSLSTLHSSFKHQFATRVCIFLAPFFSPFCC